MKNLVLKDRTFCILVIIILGFLFKILSKSVKGKYRECKIKFINYKSIDEERENMSYTKEIFEKSINKPIACICKKTMEENDCSILLSQINDLMTVRDKFIEVNEECGSLWNEICIDSLSVINSAFSGFYRTAIVGLRSIYEIGCSSIFYHDHMIEYHLFKNEDKKADKYVSALVNEFDFFKSKYIRAFNSSFDSIQKEEDGIAKHLIRLYRELSDVVHGRYNKLTNIDVFQIEYNFQKYKQFEKLFIETTDMLLLVSILRFNIELENNKKIFERTGVIKHE
mgnify:CR=1 FL=1